MTNTNTNTNTNNRLPRALLSGDGGGTARRGATTNGEPWHGATSTSVGPLVNVAARERWRRPSTNRALRGATVLPPARWLLGCYGEGAKVTGKTRRFAKATGAGAARRQSEAMLVNAAPGERPSTLDELGALQGD